MGLEGTTVLVVGAGIMGTGIAQVAAQAGHPVLLHDLRPGAADDAKGRLSATLDGLVAKGRLGVDEARDTLARIEPIASLQRGAAAGLVVEAVVEQLEAKRQLFRELEDFLGDDVVFATNTSSISVTSIARDLRRPARLVGMHFFNPVPLMKLVEVVSGLHTDAHVAAAIFDLARAWGKVPVHAKSTPGFIVNRIARPYYAEALALLHEQAASPEVIDACLKAAGFRMGPCELMDLIGLDTNFAVTSSVFEANFFDKRYVPSPVQREMVEGGLLGRKSGRGFYRYPDGAPALPVPLLEAPHTAGEVVVHGDGPIADALESAAARALAAHGWGPARVRGGDWVGVRIDGGRLVLTDGRPAHDVGARMGSAEVALFDRPLVLPSAPGQPLAFTLHPGASVAWRSQAPAWLHGLGFTPLELPDTPALVVARTVAMLINEAADAVLQGVCSAEGADAAMKLGVNWPAGPFDWLRAWGASGVSGVIAALDETYRGERYRLSPWLRRARAIESPTGA